MTAVLATVPHYFWIIRTTGAGAAPFSDPEMKCIHFLWSPVLERMSRDASMWPIIAIIATSWFVFAAAAASVWIVVRRKARISVIGTFLFTSLVVELCLRLLAILSPLTMPG